MRLAGMRHADMHEAPEVIGGEPQTSKVRTGTNGRDLRMSNMFTHKRVRIDPEERRVRQVGRVAAHGHGTHAHGACGANTAKNKDPPE